MRIHLLTTVTSLLFAFPVIAKPAFTPIPADQTGGKVSGLELRIVRYDGATNVVIAVDRGDGIHELVDHVDADAVHVHTSTEQMVRGFTC